MATNRLRGLRCVSTQRASGVSFWTHIEAERVREEQRERGDKVKKYRMLRLFKNSHRPNKQTSHGQPSTREKEREAPSWSGREGRGEVQSERRGNGLVWDGAGMLQSAFNVSCTRKKFLFPWATTKRGHQKKRSLQKSLTLIEKLSGQREREREGGGGRGKEWKKQH